MLRDEVKKFIERYIDLIDIGDIKQLYKLAKDEIKSSIADLTNTLYEADIDPLMFTDTVPPHYLAGDSDFDNFDIVNSNITEIGARAFECCYDLQKVWIPKQITSIGYSAFDCCISLEDLQFEKLSNLKRIDSYAFASCEQLTEVELPVGLIMLGSHVFDNSGLRTLTLPASLTFINVEAFSGLHNCTFRIKKGTPADTWFKNYETGGMIIEYY